MRYVDLDSLRGREGLEKLIEDAHAVAEQVAAADDAESRRAIISSNDARWKAFRFHFEQLLGRKCWYTESSNLGSDDDVDHFRPKGGIVERPEHGGYWWLAFDWKNYRLSCHRANRLRRRKDLGATLGKGEHFPLIVENERWMSPQDTCVEQPSLLDPTDPTDPPMLTYDIDGTAALHPSYAGMADAETRIDESRLYLHLDWPPFVEQRAGLYGTIATKVENLDPEAQAALDGDQDARRRIKEAAKELIRMTDPRAPYSRAAEAYIRNYRDREWVQKFVLNNLGPVT